jgi:hypothetical protein
MRCKTCGRKALFRVNGKVKTDKQHDLCQRCYRDLINHLRAKTR